MLIRLGFKLPLAKVCFMLFSRPSGPDSGLVKETKLFRCVDGVNVPTINLPVITGWRFKSGADNIGCSFYCSIYAVIEEGSLTPLFLAYFSRDCLLKLKKPRKHNQQERGVIRTAQSISILLIKSFQIQKFKNEKPLLMERSKGGADKRT